MASKPVDQSTQTAASSGAQNASTVASQNSATAQNTANNQISTLFGTYNPQTNQYSGGTESQYLNPSSMNQPSLTGSFANAYGTEANTNAQGAQNAVRTSQQQADANGQGKTPIGYQADQARQAYQQEAQNNATNYSGLFGAQNTQAVNQYNNANQMLAASANQNQNSATANNNTAAGTNTSLYGTASAQTPTALGSVLGAAGALGSAAIGKIPCWIAAEIYGGWYDPRTVTIRQWLMENFEGHWLLNLYIRFGERMAIMVREHRPMRWFFTRIFNHFLRLARKAK